MDWVCFFIPALWQGATTHSNLFVPSLWDASGRISPSFFTVKRRFKISIGVDRSAHRRFGTRNSAGVIGLIDADFDHLEGKTPDVLSVFQTDMHDGECFMLSTIAFEKLLSEFSSQEKLKAWQQSYVTDVRSYLLQQAAIISSLLWHSNQLGLNLCFKELETKEYVDDASLKIDVPKFVKHVKNKSQRHDLSDDKLTSGLQQRLEASNKIWQMVRSHDLIDLLSFAYRKTLGSWKAQDLTREHIERGLRLAYAEDDFSQTQLFLEIRGWEAAHMPFRIFRNLRQKHLPF